MKEKVDECVEEDFERGSAFCGCLPKTVTLRTVAGVVVVENHGGHQGQEATRRVFVTRPHIDHMII
jgi:hypothetical protein